MRTGQEAFNVKPLLTFFLAVALLTAKGSSWSYLEPAGCGDCKGGITTLTLQYQGTSTANVVIQDSKDVYFSGTLIANQRITITGTKNNGTFQDKQLDLLINGTLDVNIDVDCGQSIFVKSVFGKFLVTAGESRQGGQLCCAPNTVDTTPPAIQNCPQKIEVVAGEGKCKQIATWAPPTAHDDCALNSFTSTHLPGENFPVGITDVVYTATDASNNSSSCTFQVIVKDNQNPVFQGCPKDIIVHTSETMTTAEWGALTATDNCGAVNITASHSPGDLFGIGVTQVSYTAVDNSKNSTVCEFTITVLRVDDSSLHIATFLTPDGDGINDVWTIDNIDGFAQNRVTIVDRWGNTIFTGAHYNNESTAWDGTDKTGKKVAAGTYFYSLDLGNGSKVKRGFIEVIH